MREPAKNPATGLFTSTYVLRVALMALAYFVSGQLVFSANTETLDNNIVTLVIFIPEGIALAAVILYGRRLWPGIFLGQWLLALSAGIPMLPALGVSMVNSIEAFMGATLFNNLGFRKDLRHIRDVLGLLGLIIFVLQPFSAIFGNLVLYAAEIVSLREYGSSLLSWWFGNSIAQMLFTPTLLLIHANHSKINLLELVAVLLLSLALNFLLLDIFAINSLAILLSLVLPMVILLAAYKSVACAAMAATVTALATVYATHWGIGAFSSKDATKNIIDLNFYILLQIFLALVMGTLFQEKRRNEKLLREKNEALKNSLVLQAQVERIVQHDLKTPLNGLIHVPSLIMEDEPGLSSESVRLLKRCEESAYKMLEMINRSLDLYKMETGNYRLQPQTIDLIPLLKRVLIDCRVAPDATAASLLITLEGHSLSNEDKLLVRGEELLCYSLFSNLVRNAKEASPADESPHIVLNRCNEEHMGVVTIINKGEVPAEVRPCFFDKLVTSGKHSGLGLGTYSARLCTEAQGGSIVLNPPLAGKTSVTVKLPAPRRP